MPCYFPISAWKVDGAVVFNSALSGKGLPLKLPCGRCIGCRLERSKMWAVRCIHEASLYDKNCFITLTYSDDYLPADGSVDVTHFQKFMKRLRFRFGSGVRFFHCGEYGERTHRPHYHALLFNCDFEDKQLHTVRNGNPVYTSDILRELWPMGLSEIGDVTFESAAYVARYIMKKVTGDGADEHYLIADPDTGELFRRKPEYITMSRRPGIGYGWLEKYQSDVYPHDRVVVRGRPMKVPKFYDRKFETIDPVSLNLIKVAREKKSKLYLDDMTPERLQVKHEVQRLAASRLLRPLD